MSFRDTRKMLRALGYPSLVSMETFRTANFALVATLLVWLTKRFDPDSELVLEIESEEDRVQLIRNAAQFMALKAGIKLNTKKLYQADGYAVKELLKITSLLYKALSFHELEDNLEDDSFNLHQHDFNVSDKIGELKVSRQLASEITNSGANLFDLLGKETELRPLRLKSIGRQFELNEVEDGIKRAIQLEMKEIEDIKGLIDNVAATEASLDSKIERRKIDIDRYEKRLQTLKKVRPAFLDEFTALEKELEQLFVQYSIRLRCLNQLEKAFASSERSQIKKELAMTSPRIQVIPLERHESEIFDEEPQVLRQIARQERPRASTGGRNRGGTEGKAYGTMTGSQSSLELSSDSETDNLFLDKDEPELVYSDEEESIALEMERMDRRVPTGRKTSSKIHSNSDDDF